MDVPGKLRAEEQLLFAAVTEEQSVGSPNISSAAEAAELKEQEEEGHALNTPWTMWLDK